jgi:hypothetical protein
MACNSDTSVVKETHVYDLLLYFFLLYIKQVNTIRKTLNELSANSMPNTSVQIVSVLKKDGKLKHAPNQDVVFKLFYYETRKERKGLPNADKALV